MTDVNPRTVSVKLGDANSAISLNGNVSTFTGAFAMLSMAFRLLIRWHLSISGGSGLVRDEMRTKTLNRDESPLSTLVRVQLAWRQTYNETVERPNPKHLCT